MNWNKFTDLSQLDNILTESAQKTVVLFKHSTRCSISSMALSRLERAWKDAEMQGVSPYFVDLIAYRNVSNKIAEQFEVQHESPQVLVIKNGICTYHNSHSGISYEELKQVV
jgi:bacillithiol system protein YtxJ